MKQNNESKTDSLDLHIIQLINEIKKPGREPLYDSNNRSYKNNLEKNRIWEGIGRTLQAETAELQKLWKHLKRKYINIILTNKITESNIELVNAMDYFKNYYFTKDNKSFNDNEKEPHTEVEEEDDSVDFRRTRELQLIEELKKGGREVLYDYSNPDYKNNFIKKRIWEKTGQALNISGCEAQKIWKNLKREFFTQIKNENVILPRKLEPRDMKLMKEMKYFKKFFFQNEKKETQLDLDVSNSEDILKEMNLDPLKMKEFQLIEEMKKPEREPLYDPTNPHYLHKATKNKIWTNIAETLKLNPIEAQKLWRNLKKKYFYRIERKKNGLGIVVPKKIKQQEMLFMLKMSYFDDFFILDENNSSTISEELKNDLEQNILNEFSSEINEFCVNTNNCEFDSGNPVKVESERYIHKIKDNEFEMVDKELKEKERENEEENEQFYAPKRKKQKFIESATNVIEKINATNDAIIEKLMSQPINSSKKTVVSTFVSYLEAVLETKSPAIQKKIISEINEILKYY